MPEYVEWVRDEPNTIRLSGSTVGVVTVTNIKFDLVDMR